MTRVTSPTPLWSHRQGKCEGAVPRSLTARLTLVFSLLATMSPPASERTKAGRCCVRSVCLSHTCDGLQEVDTDGNGVVDTKEFLDWIVERKQATDLVVRS